MGQSAVVSIVIPVFNQWQYTDVCLKALYQNQNKDIPFEVIVVDNASTDFTSEGLKDWLNRWQALRIERFDSNKGFSLACNRGAQLSKAPFVLFLNNDTIPQPNWLEPLFYEIQNSEVGIAAPKLLYPHDLSINHVGYVFGRGSVVGQGTFYAIYHKRPATLAAANIKRDYQALLGACIIMRRELFFNLGEFGNYGLEDIDLCLKVQQKSLKCRYVPESVVYHHGSVTLKMSEFGSLPSMNALDFQQKWKDTNFIWDDYLWYILDGEWPAPPPSNDCSIIESANQSLIYLLRSYREFNSGNYDQAQLLSEKALQIWPLNPLAFAFWIKVLIETGQSNLVIANLSRLGEFAFSPFVTNEILPQLQKVLPPEIWASLDREIKLLSA